MLFRENEHNIFIQNAVIINKQIANWTVTWRFLIKCSLLVNLCELWVIIIASRP